MGQAQITPESLLEHIGFVRALADQAARLEAGAVRDVYSWDRAAERIEQMAYAAMDQATATRPAEIPRTTAMVAT